MKLYVYIKANLEDYDVVEFCNIVMMYMDTDLGIIQVVQAYVNKISFLHLPIALVNQLFLFKKEPSIELYV